MIKIKSNKIGLSLSGGGYRAAAFHLGTLRYLHNQGLFKKIDFLSTVSGGSILGATYCLQARKYKTFDGFETHFRSMLRKSVIGRVLISPQFLFLFLAVILVFTAIVYFLVFTSFPWVSFIVLISFVALFIKYQFRLIPVSQIIESIYDKIFFEGSALEELCEKPNLIINSTNLQTGRLFYFTRDKMSDSSYDGSYSPSLRKVFKHEGFPIARAVMCSSCVPSFFTPIPIESHWLVDINDANKINPLLVDGGIYDNQGIHKLTHPGGQYECDIVIVSDAGNLLPFEGSFNNILTLLLRTVEVFMNRIKAFQMMINLYRSPDRDGREIAYVTLGWNLENLISDFVRNLRNGNIVTSVKNHFGLTDDYVSGNTDEKIRGDVSKRINYDTILKKFPSVNQVRTARSVTTNLTALSGEQIDSLALYAEVMTEIQIKLYCPTLFER